MTNPNRGRGGYINGRGGSPHISAHRQERTPPVTQEAPPAGGDLENQDDNLDVPANGAPAWNHRGRGRGFVPRGLGPRGGVFPGAFGGRGNGFRGGRGGLPPAGSTRGYRGRGRGAPTPHT